MAPRREASHQHICSTFTRFFRKTLSHKWLTCHGHIWISLKFQMDLSFFKKKYFHFFFIFMENLKLQSFSHLMFSSIIISPTFSDGSLTWHSTEVFVLFGQHNHIKPAIKLYNSGASKASPKTLCVRHTDDFYSFPRTCCSFIVVHLFAQLQLQYMFIKSSQTFSNKVFKGKDASILPFIKMSHSQNDHLNTLNTLSKFTFNVFVYGICIYIILAHL